MDITDDQILRLRAPGGFRNAAGVTTAGPDKGNGAENGAGNSTGSSAGIGARNNAGTRAGNGSGNSTGNGTGNESSTDVGNDAGNGIGSGGENGAGIGSRNAVGNGAAPESVRVEFKVDSFFIADNDVVLTTYELLRTKPTIFRKVICCFFGGFVVRVFCFVVLCVLVVCCGFLCPCGFCVSGALCRSIGLSL